MGSVELTGVTPPLFITTVLFLLAFFSMLSLLVVRLFQKRFGSAVFFGIIAIVVAVVYVLVLKFGLGY